LRNLVQVVESIKNVNQQSHTFEVGDLVKNQDTFILHYGIVVNSQQVFIFGCKSPKDMSAVVWLEPIGSRTWRLAQTKPVFSSEEIVERCKRFARKLKAEPMEYNLFTNNCEHIARYLVEGEAICTQMSIPGVMQNLLSFMYSRSLLQKTMHR
jgi:hypothetical protein